MRNRARQQAELSIMEQNTPLADARGSSQANYYETPSKSTFLVSLRADRTRTNHAPFFDH